MLGDTLIIYLLIGCAHWLAHSLTCPNCRPKMISLGELFADGFILLFGWPIQAASYTARFFTKNQESGITKDELAQLISDKLDKQFKGRMADVGIMEIKQQPGESTDDFSRRIFEALQARMKEARAKKDTSHEG